MIFDLFNRVNSQGFIRIASILLCIPWRFLKVLGEIPTFVLNFRLTQKNTTKKKVRRTFENFKLLEISRSMGESSMCIWKLTKMSESRGINKCFSETVPTACGRGRAVRSEMTTLCGSSGYYSYKHLPKGHRIKQP